MLRSVLTRRGFVATLMSSFFAGILPFKPFEKSASASFLWGLLDKRASSVPVKEITPNDVFYNVSYSSTTPEIDIHRWSLSVDGLVRRPITISYKELSRFAEVSQYVTLICIGNRIGGDLIGNALWTGIRLKDILEYAEPLPSVKKVVFHCGDHYTDSVPIERALEPFNLVATKMNGEILPVKHGYPARIIVPGIYGMKNCKWLKRIELVDYDYKGYWEERGWSDDAVIHLTSRIDTPADGEEIPLAPYSVTGVAFGGLSGVKGVELSLDGGVSWNKVEIKSPLSTYSWSVWSYRWMPKKSGRYSIVARAIDGEGKIQVAEEKRAFPDGAYGWHMVNVTVKT